jgi:hypothetical protein
MHKVKIFLASSAELDEDKEKVELFIGRKNRDWYKKRIFLELTTWKDFISSITEDRTQAQYNKYIRQSDISVFLFSTKLGRYTKEEFDNAHQAFLTCRKNIKTPRIYTYFKTEKVETDAIGDFKKYIDSLDHFYDTYTSMEDLFVKFNRQLDMLEEEGAIIKPEPVDLPRIVKYAIYFFLIPILVLVGIFFSFYFFQPANLTVKIKETKPVPGLPFQQGKISLSYGDKTDVLTVKDEAIFKQIPSKYKHSKLTLRFEAAGFIPIDTLFEFAEIIELPIIRDNSLAVMFGFVRDENGTPIPDATVSASDIQTTTNNTGNFKLNIPVNMQAEEQQLKVYKKGYKLWNRRIPVFSNAEIPVQLIK